MRGPSHNPGLRWTWMAVLLALIGAVLVGHPARAEPDVLAGLRDPSPRRRIEAAWRAAMLRTPQARAAWVAALSDAKRPELHFEAVARLADFQPLDPEVRKALEAAREHADPAVRLAVSAVLGEVEEHQGPLDTVRKPRPGEAVLGKLPLRLPAEGVPARLDAASLDGSLWVRRSPITILGEGTVTFVFLKRSGEDVVARAASATRRLTRHLEPGSRSTRTWTTTWAFATRWIDVRSNRWFGGAPAPYGQPGEGAPTDGTGVGLVHGHLAVPSLVRESDGRWTYGGVQDVLDLRFDGALAVGKSGTVDVTIRPRVAPELSGKARWRVEQAEDGPRLRIDERMDIPGGFRRIEPREFLLGTSGRCGAAVVRSRHMSAMYAFAGIR